MSRHYSEAETIAIVADLTASRLGAFVRARVVSPLATPQGPAYREADLARLQLLCDLSECYELQDDALAMVMSLIDQLNTMRGDMRALMQAVASEPDEVRHRVGSNVRRVRIRLD
ncbi:hypothetical protein [Paracoccus siganidrum]|nr:hypothetical protein [Paracoccus siganidrum]